MFVVFCLAQPKRKFSHRVTRLSTPNLIATRRATYCKWMQNFPTVWTFMKFPIIYRFSLSLIFSNSSTACRTKLISVFQFLTTVNTKSHYILPPSYFSLLCIASQISPILQFKYSHIRKRTESATSSFRRSFVIVPVAMFKSFLSVAGVISLSISSIQSFL